MDDLISRQAAIDLLKQMRKDGDMAPWEGKNVFARIRKMPSAQPEHPMVNIAKVTMAMANKADMVAVTRCKDCKHGAEYPEDKEWPWRCSGVWYDGDGGDQCVRPTSYCSFAERRTDE